uniref:Uncharacterized protein n=1 Tax=Sphaerodactylus townsendi TaxID=933632 RepID=A0ACB8FPJ6_9SAUR
MGILTLRQLSLFISYSMWPSLDEIAKLLPAFTAFYQGLSGHLLTVGQLPPSEMSHTERSLLDCDAEELERTLRFTDADAEPMAPLLSETTPQNVLARTQAARWLQFGPSWQTAAQGPSRDSFGCYPITWSEPGQDILSDWDHDAPWERCAATLPVNYKLPDPGGGDAGNEFHISDLGAAAPRQLMD